MEQENDVVKKVEKPTDKTYSTGFYRKAYTKKIDYDKYDERPGQLSISKYVRRNERPVKEDNSDNKIAYRGKSSYIVHNTKKEENDNKKNDNVVIKREVFTSKYNMRGGDAPNTYVTSTTTKVTTSNLGGTTSFYSRKKQDSNVGNTGLQTKVETKK